MIEETTKKCPFCAEDIRVGAIVCRYCGRDLPTTTPTVTPELPNIKNKSIKSATTATILNAIPIIFGLGYIYIGKWGRFTTILLIQLFSLLPMTMLGLREYNPYLLLIVWLVSMVDVYTLTQEENKK